MNITKSDLIAGFPAAAIRDLLRGERTFSFNRRIASHYLGVDETRAQNLMDELEALGFIEKAPYHREGLAYYEVTTKGNSVANASAAPPVSRKTAERKLLELMQRVREVNTVKDFAYEIESVILFGSFLSDKEKLGDVDVIVELKPKTADRAELRRLSESRIDIALSAGRTFQNLTERMLWPRIEVRQYIKGRSRVISLHDMDDLAMLRSSSYRVLLGNENRINELIFRSADTDT